MKKIVLNDIRDIKTFFKELRNIPEDYELSVCGIFDLALCIDDINGYVVLDEESYIDELLNNDEEEG